MQTVDFTARPKFAAAGIFTQMEAIVCKPRKTHRDTNNSHNDIFEHVHFRFARLQPDGCFASMCMSSLRDANNSESTRKPEKFCISKTADRGSVCSLCQ